MLRKFMIFLLVVVSALGALWIFGPREPADTTISFDAASLGDDPDAYVQKHESGVANLNPDTAKEIVWAFPQSKAKTPYSIVYVHGFSATKGELRPLPDRIAAELGANLFYTRLTGHGRDGPAMAKASVNDWINDIAEALAIGRAIGDKVIVIGTSTGATLMTWAATQPALMENVAGLIQFSPNFGTQAAGSFLLTGPFARTIVPLVGGAERKWEPVNELHAKYWTHHYPTVAVIPMGALVKLANDAPVERAAVPSLFIFHEGDKVVRPDLTRKIAARWGGPAEIFVQETTDDPYLHVIAGDALSPSSTSALVEKAVAWINALPK